MKKLLIFSLIFVLSLSLFGCRRNNTDETTATTSTEITILPEIDPTLETNIPDPEVDTSIPEGTDDILDETQNTTDSQNNTVNEGSRNMPY